MKEREITKNNYFETIEDIGLKTLPAVLKQSHKVIVENTGNGTDWSKYEGDENLKRMTDLAFTKLQEFIRTKHGLSGVTDGKPKQSNRYSGIAKEVSFINRFLDLNDKVVYKNTLEILIDKLQNAITNKEITKKSPVAKDIMFIQESLIALFNSTVNAKHIILKPATIKRMKTIIEKYENSYDDLDQDYVKAKKKNIGLKGLNGVKDSDILDSTEFIKMEFPSIGFKGKWFDLIGDPCTGFTMMVYGMPKTGKSYLCVDFAGYLAQNHGKVLYVAKEEKADSTLKQKFVDKKVAHPNLKLTGALPNDISEYDYIFLDSVNKLRLRPEDLEKLKAKNKGKSFIYIFQATKGGQFKGNNEFKHDVDVVVEVPEIGKAVQYGRFNQGGTMNIFEKASTEVLSSSEDLSGVKSNKEKAITIKPTLCVPLTEFEFLIERGESVQEAIRNSKTEAENWAEKLTLEEISKAGAKVKVDAVYFISNDDFEDEEQNSYYDIKLSGTESELRKVVGKDKILLYDWKDKKEIKPNKEKRSTKAEKLNSTQKYFEKHKDDYDSDNPKFLFQSISTPLLVDALKKEYDIEYVIRLELSNRGLDEKGNWVGFDKAKVIHNIN